MPAICARSIQGQTGTRIRLLPEIQEHAMFHFVEEIAIRLREFHNAVKYVGFGQTCPCRCRKEKIAPRQSMRPTYMDAGQSVTCYR